MVMEIGIAIRGALINDDVVSIKAGAGIVKDSIPEEDDIIITKWRYSAFENTQLKDLIKKLGKDQIIITGIYAHIACLMTSVVASMKNIKPFIVSDAIGEFSQVKHKMALEYISQLSGMIINTECFLF